VCPAKANQNRGKPARSADRSAPMRPEPISGVGRLPRRVSPGAEREARLPVRQKLHCEALSGVADPITTVPREVDRLYPGGWIVLVSRILQHAVKLD
jgi:hypothetical protein